MAITINGSGITSSEIADGTITTDDIASGVTGKVLQVVSTTKTDTLSTTSTTATNMTGMSVTITPASTSSKFLITSSLYFGQSSGYNRTHVTITGGNSSAYIGDANSTLRRVSSCATNRVNDGYGMNAHTLSYLDSPATTSAITYQLQWQTNGSTSYLNRPSSIDVNGGSTASTITVMEIGA
jgi:hypothetical protein